MQEKKKVLLVEDDNSLRSSLGMFLEKNGSDVTEVRNAEEAVVHLERGLYDLVVADLKLHDKDGLWLLGHIKHEFPETRVLIMSAYSDVDTAVNALKSGASDFLVKPFTPPDFIDRCEEAMKGDMPPTKIERAHSSPLQEIQLKELVGRSEGVKQMKELLRLASGLEDSILLCGETGTGRELLARCIHEESHRGDHAFVLVDCAAQTEHDLDKDLFDPDSLLLEKARGGTLCLASVQALSATSQAKLARILEAGSYRKAGGGKEQSVDFRLICCSGTGIENMVKEGIFSQDLFFRLNKLQLNLKPLRERVEDVPIYMGYFLRVYNLKYTKRIKGFSRQVLDLFERYDWPGNVRELKNVVERAVLFCSEEYIQGSQVPANMKQPRIATGTGGVFDGAMTLKDLEKMKILETLKAYGGNRATTAKALGIGRNTLWRKLKEYEIEE